MLNAGGATHDGAAAPRIGPLTDGFTAAGTAGAGTAGGGPPWRWPPAAPPPPPRRAATSPCAKTLRDSNTPSLLASRRTVMSFDAGELTNRSPFGAYTIMRGAGTSA